MDVPVPRQQLIKGDGKRRGPDHLPQDTWLQAQQAAFEQRDVLKDLGVLQMCDPLLIVSTWEGLLAS
jgi:hypothetical protein